MSVGSTTAVRTRFEDAFRAGARFELPGAQFTIEVRQVGELSLPTGRLCVADPLMTFGGRSIPELKRSAPRGRFPVELALLRSEHDTRVACARVRFSEAGARHWEHARLTGWFPPKRYPVGSGVGSFFDRSIAERVAPSEAERWATQMTDEGDTWSHHTAESGGANVVMFSSGLGDGEYASYWGFDGAGQVAELVTDFEVLVVPNIDEVRLALPLPNGIVDHPELKRLGITMTIESDTVIVSGGPNQVQLATEPGGQIIPRSLQSLERWRLFGDLAGVQLRVVIDRGGPMRALAAITA